MLSRLKDRVGRWNRVIIAGVISSVIAASFSLSIYSLVTLASSNCHDVQGLERVLTAQIQASAGRIGQPGTAGYAYYKEHPQELKDQQRQTTQFLKLIDPTKCP